MNKFKNTYTHILYSFLKQINKKKAVLFLIKSYLYSIKPLKADGGGDSEPSNNYIWAMWWQNEMPEIVQICINSIKKFYPNLIIITEKNVYDYIELPDYIKQKFEQGKISCTHLSDIIRVCLLDKYGGTWIDATCYLTQKIPNFILKQNVHFLTNSDSGGISNWFIHAKPHNYIIRATKSFLFEYWLHNDSVCDYFIFHKFIALAKMENKTFEEEWNKIEFIIYNKPPCAMAETFFNKTFDKDTFDYLCKASFIHKLTYKVKAKEIAKRFAHAHPYTQDDLNNFCNSLKEIETNLTKKM